MSWIPYLPYAGIALALASVVFLVWGGKLTITGLNSVKSNVWAVCLIALGAYLLLKGHDAAGTSLITGSFAILKVSAEHGNGDEKAAEIKN